MYFINTIIKLTRWFLIRLTLLVWKYNVIFFVYRFSKRYTFQIELNVELVLSFCILAYKQGYKSLSKKIWEISGNIYVSFNISNIITSFVAVSTFSDFSFE